MVAKMLFLDLECNFSNLHFELGLELLLRSSLRDLVCLKVSTDNNLLFSGHRTPAKQRSSCLRTNVNASNVKSLTKLCLLEERATPAVWLHPGWNRTGPRQSFPGPTSWRSSRQLSRHRTQTGQLVFKEDLSVSVGDIVGGNASFA
jgi:hypothetical protein